MCVCCFVFSLLFIGPGIIVESLSYSGKVGGDWIWTYINIYNISPMFLYIHTYMHQQYTTHLLWLYCLQCVFDKWFVYGK